MDISDFTFFNLNYWAYYKKEIGLYDLFIVIGALPNYGLDYSEPNTILNDINQYKTINVQIGNNLLSSGKNGLVKVSEEANLGIDNLGLIIVNSHIYMNYTATIKQLEDVYDKIRQSQGLRPTKIGAISNYKSSQTTIVGHPTNTGGSNCVIIGKDTFNKVDGFSKTGGNCKKCKAYDKYAPLDDNGECLCYRCFS
jgi:hypothetical protein